MKKPVLLAVDDKAESLRVIRELLGEHLPDCEVITAQKPEEGLRIATGGGIDAALVDAHMPRMDGIELCRRMKDHPASAHVPVVLMTGRRSTPELRIRAIEAGADDFISKPIAAVELAARARAMLRIKRAEDELRAAYARLEEGVTTRTESLRQSEERFRALFETIPGAVFVHGGDRYLDVNGTMERITGYTRDELLAMPFWKFLHPDFQDLIRDRGQARRRGEVPPTPYEAKIVTKDGEERWVVIAARRVPFQGEAAVLGTLIDITDLKAAQAAAEGQRSLLMTLMDAMPDYIYIKDAESRFILNNRAHLRLLGVATQEDVAGKTDADIFPQELATEYRDDERAVIASGQPLLNREEKTEDPEGNKQWVLTTKVPFRDSQGRVVGLVGISRNITARKHTEEEVRAHVSFLNTIMDQSPFSMWISDNTGTVLRTNKALREALNLTDEQIVGKYNVLTDANLDEQGVMPQVKAVFEEHRPARFSIPWAAAKAGDVAFRGGRDLWIDVAMFPILDGDGNLRNAVCQWVDITERKRAEEALRESEAMVRGILRAVPLGIGVARARAMLWSNDQMTDLIGYSQDECSGRNLRMLWETDAEFERAMDAFGQGIAQTGIGSVETRLVRKDGSRFEAFMLAARLDPSDPSSDIIAALSDITERKQAEEALRESEVRYRTLFDAGQDAIFLFPVDAGTGIPLRFAEVNKTACRMFGYTREELLSMSPVDLIAPEYHEILPGLGTKLLESGLFRAEWEDIAKDGRRIPVDVSVTLFELKGQPISMAVVRDITARKQAEEEREKLREQLTEAQKMESIGRLAGGVAHDFNNILQSMMVRIGFLTEDVAQDDSRREDLDGIRHGIERAAALVKQLLAFGRRQVLDLKEIDLNVLAGDFVKMLRRVIREDIELEFVSGEDLGLVRADPAQIEQVLMNLCVNARDAMPEGGTIAVETQHVVFDAEHCKAHPWAEPGHYVLLTVRDTGLGMDERTREQVFDPFFTTKEVGKGTGLGLATVYGLIVQHHGMVEVSSEVGKGTIFHVYLPRTERRTPAVESMPHPRPKGGSETILLAEDDEILRQMIVRILTQAGYRVIAATNGEEAILLFDEHRHEIDLALLDVVMPKKGGKQVRDHIKSVQPRTRILFYSGYSEEAVRARSALEEGAPLIQKPFKPQALLAKVREVLDT